MNFYNISEIVATSDYVTLGQGPSDDEGGVFRQFQGLVLPMLMLFHT